MIKYIFKMKLKDKIQKLSGKINLSLKIICAKMNICIYICLFLIKLGWIYDYSLSINKERSDPPYTFI